MSLQLLPADEAAGDREEAFVDVVAAVGADEESAAVVQPSEGAFDDPALAAESGAMLGLAASDRWLDAALPEQATVLVVVVAAVSDQHPRFFGVDGRRGRGQAAPGRAARAAGSRRCGCRR